MLGFDKMTLKRSVNTMVAVIVTFIVVFQAAMTYYFFNEVRSQLVLLRKTSVNNFLNFISSHMESLENKKNALVSSALLSAYIADKNNEQKKYELSELAYTVQLIDSDILHMMFFEKNSDEISITNNISANELECARRSYDFYKNSDTYYMNEYADFFAIEFNQVDDLYFLKIVPVYYHDFATASNIYFGELCVFSQISTDSFHSLETENENLQIEMYSDSSKINVVNLGAKSKFSLKETFTNVHIPKTRWYFGGSVSMSIKSLDLTMPILLLLIDSLLLTAFIVCLNYYLNSYILKPFDKIYLYLKKLRISDKFSKLEVFKNSEMRLISEAINDMVIRNKDLANEILENQGRLYAAEASRKDAVIYALQNQVNPHYMYNIFEIIRSIACVNDVEEIEIIVSNMSEILRYNLKDSVRVTVADEYAIMLKYLEIMKVKYNGAFYVECNLDKEVLDTEIMKMVFQPILENAFNHGYIRREEKFGIKVSGKKKNNILSLEFYDNGRGISKDRLDNIRNSFKDNRYTASSSIGLKNLNYRLKTFYGDKAEIFIESKEGEYTKITIKINL